MYWIFEKNSDVIKEIFRLKFEGVWEKLLGKICLLRQSQTKYFWTGPENLSYLLLRNFWSPLSKSYFRKANWKLRSVPTHFQDFSFFILISWDPKSYVSFGNAWGNWYSVFFKLDINHRFTLLLKITKFYNIISRIVESFSRPMVNSWITWSMLDNSITYHTWIWKMETRSY